MKSLTIFMLILASSIKGFSQDEVHTISHYNNLREYTSCVIDTNILVANKCENNKNATKNHSFKIFRKQKFIRGKVNKNNFAVFETDINLSKALDLNVEFHMDKYNNKMALFNVNIPLAN